MRYILIDKTNDTVYLNITNLPRFAKIFRIPYGLLLLVVDGMESEVVTDLGAVWTGYMYDETEEVEQDWPE